MKAATTCGVLLLLLASGAHSQFISFPPVGPIPVPAPPSPPGTVISSGATCAAHADASFQRSVENKVLGAFKRAVINTCSSGRTLDTVLRSNTQALVGAAHAIVNMTVAALSVCTTTNNAIGCAKASAYATTQAEATITVVSKAYANAINNCAACDTDPVLVRARVKDMAVAAAALAAKVKAQVRTKVCVGPNSSASAAAYVTCSAQVWAHGLAYALAKAMIKGNCFGWDVNLTADALAQVESLIRIDPYCVCKGFSSTCDASGCQTRYTPFDDSKMRSIYGPLKTPIPSTFANFVSECVACGKELPVVINSFDDWRFVEPRPTCLVPPCVPIDKTLPRACVSTERVTSVAPQDVYFLADTTLSMFEELASVREGASDIAAGVRAVAPDAAFGVGEFKDVGDVFIFRNNQAMTKSDSAVAAGIAKWSASGGGTTPEGWLYALTQLATTNAAGWRAGAVRIVVLFGDAPSNDPSSGATLATTIDALIAAKIYVIVIDVGALNSEGQGAAVATKTGGKLVTGVKPATIVDTITTALDDVITSLATVRVSATCTDPKYSVAFDAPSKTVTSGDPACFTPRLRSTCAVPGVTCTAKFTTTSGAVIGTKVIFP